MPKPQKAGDEQEAGSSDFSAAQQKAIDSAIALKAEDPYSPLAVQGGRELLVDHIRSLRHEFSLTSFSTGWRVAIISQADRLNPSAANAFLKLLEEPPPEVSFILTSSRESRLLPTIVSRCHTLRFGPLPEEEVRSLLARRDGVDERTADAAARLSRGSWRDAVRWTREDPASEMERAVALLRDLVKGDPGLLDEKVEEWSSGNGLRELPELLNLLTVWLRDVLRLTVDPERAGQVQDEALVKFAAFVRGRSVELALEEIDEARRQMEANVQPSLVVHRLFRRLWQILFRRPARS
jgi:DNA polymerase-3 subunit delta'